MAVNSGTPLSKVTSYAKQNKITLPIIADVDRSLERSTGMTEVSLQNIYQARILLANGTVQRGNATQLDESLQKAAEGAAWNIDPADIPQSMQSLWQSIEFGGHAPAAKSIKKFSKSRKPTEKAAAAKLNTYIHDQLTSRVESAEGNTETDPWTAWKQFTQIKETFKGYELPDSVDQTLTQLSGDKSIADERAALKQFGLAQKAASGSASGRKRALGILRKLIAKYPDTEAATAAGKLLGTDADN